MMSGWILTWNIDHRFFFFQMLSFGLSSTTSLKLVVFHRDLQNWKNYPIICFG